VRDGVLSLSKGAQPCSGVGVWTMRGSYVLLVGHLIVISDYGVRCDVEWFGNRVVQIKSSPAALFFVFEQ
jgi:hypothetical protein